MTPRGCLAAGLFALLTLSCGGGGGGGGGGLPPTVFAVQTTDPRPGASTLGDTIPIRVFFTLAVDPGSIGNGTVHFTRTTDGWDHPGTFEISADARRVTWTPSTRLTLKTIYRLTVSGTVRDQYGNTLGEDYVTTFTVGSIPDPALVRQSDFRTLKSRMHQGRSDHTATLVRVPGHQYVVMIGGFTIGRSVPTGSAELVSVEDLEPQNDDGFIFATAGTMSVPRAYHTATAYRADSGLVLVAGGGTGITGTDATADCLIWSLTGGFLPTGSLNIARRLHAATLIQDSGTDLDGSVLVTGGNPVDQAGDTAEIWDPISETWTLLPNRMHSMREGHESILLRSGPLAGKVLIVGGGTDIAEIFDPATLAFTEIGDLTNSFRWMFNAVELNTSQVLLTGGGYQQGELFEPSSLTFAPVPSSDAVERYGAVAFRFVFPAGRQPDSGGPADNVLIVGGAKYMVTDGSWLAHASVSQFVLGLSGTGQYHAFDPAEGEVNLGDPRAFSAGCDLGDNRLLVTGGIPSTAIGQPPSDDDLDTVLLFEPLPD